jgi:intracellular sulfur oxidation DsrE/DsrF family protein
MNTRKEFLLTSPLFALTPAAAAAASPSPGPERKHMRGEAIPFDFNKTRFDEILAKPAKHKQCFGATKIDEGNVINGMTNTMNAYADYYDEGDGAVQTVAVLYHGAAVAMGLSNSVWNDILFPTLKHIPEELRKQFSDARPGKGNPFLSKVWLPGIVARGASFLLCNNALSGFAGIAADALKQPISKVHAAIMAGVVPGALVVPAGVMAINACQEAKFTYIQSS